MNLNADRALQAWTSGFVYLNSVRYRFTTLKNRPKQSEKIRLLLTGYNGTRNTGADVRVQEIIRQVHSVLGRDHVDISVLTFDPKLTDGYFEGVRQVSLPQIFPPFLYKECPKYHGVISVEGSMFKSKFADALTTMMAGSLGMANSENKLSIGYGAEAGKMTPYLSKFVRKHASESLVICRNKASEDILGDLNIRTHESTDTAWTFEPSSNERGQEILRAKGWDGQKPILLMAPINPFWWPVRPSLGKFCSLKLFGKHEKAHYKSIYFHDLDEEKERKFFNLSAKHGSGCRGVQCGQRLLCMPGCHGAPGRFGVQRDGGHVWPCTTIDQLSRLQHVRHGGLLATSEHPGQQSFSRHGMFHAGWGGVDWHNDGRTHRKPDEGAQPRRSLLPCRRYRLGDQTLKHA